MRNDRKIDQYVLIYLLQQPHHGFELYRKLNRILKGPMIDTAGIYRSLDKLEKKGCVTHTKVEGDKGPDKKIFAITPAGKEFLQDAYTKAKDETFNLGFFIETFRNLRNK